MPTYERALVIADVAKTHLLFAEAFKAARDLDRESRRLGTGRNVATLRALQLVYGEFNDELNLLARNTAREAQKDMRRRFERTRKRPNSGIKDRGRGLKANLVARPMITAGVGGLGTGAVGIADVERLDTVVNPLAQTARGKKPYWRAQEYGSSHLVGRAPVGFFFDAGLANPTRPGDATGQPIFVSARTASAIGASAGVRTGGGAQGGSGGQMRIQKPIEARHFIGGAADAARGKWLGLVRAIETDTAVALRGVVAPVPLARRRGARRRRS